MKNKPKKAPKVNHLFSSILRAASFTAMPMIIFAMQGCSTTSGSIATGAGFGGAMGAGVGALADAGPGGEHRFRNVVIGTAGGALLGAGAGYAIDRHEHDVAEDAKKAGAKERDEEWQKRNEASQSGGSPELIPAKTEARWVPDQVKGSTFVPGHFEYFILENAHWSTRQ